MTKLKILVAFEESQAVTIELRKLGYEAYSCDIQETSGTHPEWHIHGDALEQFKKKWDMVICFPPCTHLAVSGAAHFEKKRKDGRQREGIDLFMACTKIDCEKVVIENPIGIMSTLWRQPDQVIHPFEYGDDSTKSTCLWIKGLPLLRPTNVIEPSKHTTSTGSIYDKWWYDTCLISDLKERAKARSKTFAGIAKAMAYQFTNVDENDYYYKFNQASLI